MKAVSVRARELHLQHHTASRRLTCEDCRMAASWLIEGRVQGNVRARRAGEAYENVKAKDLLDERFIGRIVQTPGHRGYLRSAERTPRGNIHVCTATGVATYPPGQPFSVWGP